MDALEALVSDPNEECTDAPSKGCVRLVAVANLPTRFGDFRIAAFWNNIDRKEHVAVIRGDVVGQHEVPIRVHSECLTGDALGSLRCDCRDQLEAALGFMGRQERGIVVYLRQEGRGIGLLNKLKAYALQDGGLDTVDANLALGFQDDERNYRVAAEMLQILKVASVRLLTNNPDKVDQLSKYGVTVTERVPHVLPPNEHNLHYLRTKAARSGHLLDLEELATADERKAGK